MDKVRICPACGEEYTDPPAISRRDNRTAICPECGMSEALSDYLLSKMRKDGGKQDG